MSSGLLPLARCNGAAVLVTRENRPLEDFELLPHRGVRCVCHVQDHSEAVHLPEERLRWRHQPAVSARRSAVRVRADTVVREAHHAQALIPPLVDLLRPYHGVRAFHANHQPDPQVVEGLGRLPRLHQRAERLARGQDRGLAEGLQELVIRKLPHGRRIGEVLGPVLPVRVPRPLDARAELDQGRGHPGLPHLGKAGHGVGVGPVPVLHGARLGRPDTAEVPSMVPVPVKRANCHRVVAVNDQHEAWSLG